MNGKLDKFLWLQETHETEDLQNPNASKPPKGMSSIIEILARPKTHVKTTPLPHRVPHIIIKNAVYRERCNLERPNTDSPCTLKSTTIKRCTNHDLVRTE